MLRGVQAAYRAARYYSRWSSTVPRYSNKEADTDRSTPRVYRPILILARFPQLLDAPDIQLLMLDKYTSDVPVRKSLTLADDVVITR